MQAFVTVTLRLPVELADRYVAAVLEAGTSRNAWLVAAVEARLGDEAGPEVWPLEQPAVERASSEAKEPSIGIQADPGSVSSAEDVRSAAPAEQPEPSPEPTVEEYRSAPLSRTRKAFDGPYDPFKKR